jgi:hypothetical protein
MYIQDYCKEMEFENHNQLIPEIILKKARIC